MLLVDTAAEISVISPSPSDKENIQKCELYVASGTKIQTFVQKLLTLDLGLSSSFNWLFVIAEVNKLIVVKNFWSLINLLINSKNSKSIKGVISLKQTEFHI